MPESDDIDYNKSKQGETMPTDEREYRDWIRGRIADAVARCDYNGINPNANNGLRDDLRAWALRGHNDTLPEARDIIGFTTWFLSGAESLPATHNLSGVEIVNRNRFIQGAKDLIKWAKEQK